MATAEQMRQLHPDPPTRHNAYERAARDALTWLIEADDAEAEEWETGDPLTLLTMVRGASAVIRELLRYGTPGDTP